MTRVSAELVVDLLNGPRQGGRLCRNGHNWLVVYATLRARVKAQGYHQALPENRPSLVKLTGLML